MPAGDASRTWFPEITHALKDKWNPGMSWNQAIQLCRELTVLRDDLRERKGIKGPKLKCDHCGLRHHMHLTPIGIRAMLFALKKLTVIDEDEFIPLEKSWLKFQRKHRLNAEGIEKPPTHKHSSR